jgi:hypothetical protein
MNNKTSATPPDPLTPEESHPAHVNPFTVDDMEALDLPDLDGASSQPVMTAQDAGDALRHIEEKMREVTRELALGHINQAQFQAVFSRYAEQQAVIRRMLSRNPGSDAWQRVAKEGHTHFLRERHKARLLGLALYAHQDGGMIRSLGRFSLPDELRQTLPALVTKPPKAGSANPQKTQIEGGRWLVYHRAAYTTLAAVFSSEPAEEQVEEQCRLHQQFEAENSAALELGLYRSAPLGFPQMALFEKKASLSS